MNPLVASTLPPLPLLLWQAPPGLEQILAQEGVAYFPVPEPNPLVFRTGRVVLYDGRRVSAGLVRTVLTPEHIAIDIDLLRQGEPSDPFAALVGTGTARVRWQVGALSLTERVARRPRGAIRRRLISRLRRAVTGAGGLWARLAPFPYPYRSAFNFRADLDEPVVDDYLRYARAREPLADCSTHFVSTRAYGEQPDVLRDLRGFDTQSHGHHHVTYRDREANRRNLKRAHRILVDAGFDPCGFAAPHGRWNHGLDTVLEDLGYSYSSDFQVGYDDFPFFPWRDGRFSRVLQVPIHPVCEGLFLDAGARSGRAIVDYFAGHVQAKVAACEPAFVYGHPERRLGRFPEVLAALAEAIAGNPLIWRVTLTEFAHWWRWRDSRRWSIVPKPEGRYEVQLEDWDPEYPLALEVLRGGHVSTVPVTGPRMTFRLDALAYVRREVRVDLPAPAPAPWSPSLKGWLREALDWETVTPIDELPDDSLTARLKKGLRWWRRRQTAEVGSHARNDPR